MGVSTGPTLFRKRAWHEQDRRGVRALKGLLKAVVGIGVPFALLVFFITANTAKPPEQPPPPALSGEQEAGAVTTTLDGTWVVTGDSWVGYRILEDLPRLQGKHEAVGRTPAVDGTIVIDGTEVREASVDADLRELESDREWRERVLRGRYLHTDDHPRATFTLREPLRLLAVPEPGDLVQLTLPGELTLHGVTREVDVPVQARWDGDRLRVVGRFGIELADYDISPPRIYGFRLVDDHGDIEIDLSLERA